MRGNRVQDWTHVPIDREAGTAVLVAAGPGPQSAIPLGRTPNGGGGSLDQLFAGVPRVLIDLERPLVFLNVQSTGLDPRTARVVEVATLKITPDGERTARRELINPGVPVPSSATRVHGITDDDVADRPPFRSFARSLREHLKGCDLAGFGIERFALPVLKAEFARAGVEISFDEACVVDALSIFHRQEPRDLPAAYRRYVGGELHETEGDRNEAVLAILEGELRQYPELPRRVDELNKLLRPAVHSALDEDACFITDQDGEVIFNFGRYRGHPLDQVATADPGYLEWMAFSDRFRQDTRQMAFNALQGEPEDPD